MRLSDLDRMEFEFKVEDADLSKLAELFEDVNIKETPWFDISDKHGNSARYYREGHWIPCSERLPEEYGEFLVTMTEKAKAEDLGFDLDETYIRKMRYNSNGWQLPRRIPSWINEAVKDEVLAWMPLPEPYTESEGEQE